jgi:phosphatidylinositol alpha 1,6-mannosyltransferase
MDVFVFPSRTDTYGNVVLETAFGVPAAVANEGGPQFIVRSGDTGFVANNLQELCASTLHLARPAELRQNLSAATRTYAMAISWGTVFESVFGGL